MKRICPILLIGLLSMFFAEIMSGASTTWFLGSWGIFVTFPLYMFHILFFLWLAVEYRKIRITQLYFFGILFALYEAWVTKVLWSGYFDAGSPGLGTVFGIGVAEFSVLALFWHPLMSFIVPVLVFQLLTGKAFPEHIVLLRKTRKSQIVLVLFIVLFSNFIANGNSSDLISANISVIGTLSLVYFMSGASKGRDIMSLHFRKRYIALIAAYLFALYLVSFIVIMPERLPTTASPYISVILLYFGLIVIIAKSGKSSDISLVELPEGSYSGKDIFRFSVLLIVALNIECLVPSVNFALVGVTYLSMVAAGLIVFLSVVRREIKLIRH